MASFMVCHPEPEVFLQSSDAGRVLGMTGAGVRRLTARGVLTPAARTVRGDRLYRPGDVERLAAERARRRGGAR
jgi:hypothetical protein